MKDLYEYLMLMLTLSPLLFFIIAVSFRLLDNSALLFLQKEILVNTSNVSISSIRQQIDTHPDRTFTRQLKRALIYRRLHRIFLMLMFASMPVTLLQLVLS
ncbi:MAG: hypothetical protein WAM00_04650 [Salegentibacter sp.]